MWSFLSKQLQLLNPDSGTQNVANREGAEFPSRKHPLKFQELVGSMGDFSDLSKHDVAFKFWIPESVEQALDEMSDRVELSNSEFLRQFLAIHCYGLYAFLAMQDSNPRMFRDSRDGIKFSRSAPSGKRIDTYWVAELGKNVAPIKIWIPSRLRRDLEILAKHVGLTPSNYVREIVISRLLGHGMLPKRPEMFEAFPTADTDNWCEDREVEWREVSEDEFSKYNYEVRDRRTTYVDDEDDQEDKPVSG